METNLVLYRKHRPVSFEDVIAQDHIVGAIQNAIRMGRVAHAYLFSGPRGVGKTTMARLIAKAMNCAADSSKRPCNICQSCIDFNSARAMNVIEIDGASNRKIEDVRELREAVRFLPAGGTFKTYIVDEVHMLTKEAFNALLKTLEEPPAHVVFVLATTELDKVPATIISRTQHYVFHRPLVAHIARRLASLAKKEKVALADDAARLIAFAGAGSYRDAESILGQIMAVEDKKITSNEVEHILGVPRREAAKDLFAYVASKDAAAALKLTQELTDAGHDIAHFTRALTQYFRAALLLKTDSKLASILAEELLPDEIEAIQKNLIHFGAGEISRAINVLFDTTQRFRTSSFPQLPLELAIVALCQVGESCW